MISGGGDGAGGGGVGIARETEAVLFANEAFYAAFAGGDIGAMQAIWARRAPISCLHPGGPIISDRAAVLESWRAVLQAPPPIACLSPRVLFQARDAALVLCYEGVGSGYLAATNAFVLEDGAWRMSHHQAGPTQATPSPSPRPSRTLN